MELKKELLINVVQMMSHSIPWKPMVKEEIVDKVDYPGLQYLYIFYNLLHGYAFDIQEEKILAAAGMVTMALYDYASDSLRFDMFQEYLNEKVTHWLKK